MNKNIAEMSVVELKALVYDHLSNIEASQRAIQVVNAELQKRQQATGPQEVKE